MVSADNVPDAESTYTCGTIREGFNVQIRQDVDLGVARGNGRGIQCEGGVNSGNGLVTITPTFAPVPEPGSVVLFSMVLAGVALAGRRKLRVR